MGTRVLYQIMTTVDGVEVPIAVLYSNSSHNEQDPVVVFGDFVDNAESRTEVLEQMLCVRYDTAWNLHRKGDRLYHIVDEPYGDYEFIMRLGVDGDVTRIEAEA